MADINPSGAADYHPQVKITVMFHDVDQELAAPILSAAIKQLTKDLIVAGVKEVAVLANGRLET